VRSYEKNLTPNIQKKAQKDRNAPYSRPRCAAQRSTPGQSRTLARHNAPSPPLWTSSRGRPKRPCPYKKIEFRRGWSQVSSGRYRDRIEIRLFTSLQNFGRKKGPGFFQGLMNFGTYEGTRFEHGSSKIENCCRCSRTGLNTVVYGSEELSTKTTVEEAE
jgi:hypothetical protein